ncbi:MAG: TIGR02099 family protein [Betaproteobacteria bacterium]|nr:TIGR02099 family protein [Betaproteobacteria bacterium]
MSSQPDNPDRIRQALRLGWRSVRVGYDKVNRVTHHALSWLVLALIVIYFAFCAAFLSLRYIVLPNIDAYKVQVEQLASYFVNRNVRIDGIEASWHGLNPRLKLENVVIQNDQGESALVLPEVNATISWWSVMGELRLQALELSRPNLEIERDTEGRVFVGGLQIYPTKPDDGRGLDWLLAQHEIVVRQGELRWRDQLRLAPELTLSDISFVLQNRWRTHRAALKATPPESMAAPIDLRVEFTHLPFSKTRADYAEWVGEFYIYWQKTHLEAWKPYIDMPYQLTGGDGSLRAWANFDRGTVANVTADLSLSNLSVSLDQSLEPLKLINVSGRISAGELISGLKQKIFSYGESGHQLTLTNFSLRTEQGDVLPKTTVSHVYAAPANGKAEHHDLKITEMDLGALARFAVNVPLPDHIRSALSDFLPRGQLRDFSASWDGDMPGAGVYKIAGKFDALGIRQSSGVHSLPAFDGMSGEVDANQDGGRLKLNGEHLKLDAVNTLSLPQMNLDDISLEGSWSLRDKKYLAMRVDTMRFSQAGVSGMLMGSYTVPMPLSARGLGELDLKLQLPVIELSNVSRYLPAVVAGDTREWLSAALRAGRARDVTLLIKGDLDKFPFQQKIVTDNPAGIFKITAKIERATLSPAPKELSQDRRTFLWPTIDDIQGNFLLDGTRLQIHADIARTTGVALSEVHAVVPDYLSSKPVLDVSGVAQGSLQSMLTYVSVTPVSGWIDNFTEEAKASGNARLGLKMQLPLSAAGTAAVQGNVKFAGNEVQLWRAWPAAQQVTGELNFSEQGVQLPSIQAVFLGGPLSLSGGTQRDGASLIKLEGSVNTESTSRSITTPMARRVLKKITGSTRYTANLKIRNQRPELTIDSSLAGLALDFPAPLQKPAVESWPLRIMLQPLPAPDGIMPTEEIRISLGRNINARYLRQRSSSGNNTWRMVRGGIGVNTPAPQPDSGLAIQLNMPSFNADNWRSTLAGLAGEAGSGTMDNSPIPSGAGQGSAQGTDYAPFFTPDVINLRATELTIFDRPLDNMVLAAARQRSGWKFNIQSDEVIGQASWEDPSSERGAGKITARLSSLKIERSADADVTELLSGKKSAAELPGLDIVADSFDLRGMKLGRLELAATNGAIVTSGREWRISKLTLTNPDASLRATGRWLLNGSDSQSTLNYELDINDAGRLLDRVGFEKAVKGGKGRMEGDLSWKGSPSAFDFPTLSGHMNLRVNSGQFLKADPGVAKLLSVMSLQSLPRRLTLDFRDLFTDGFMFDSIASTAAISRGVLKTDTFKMRGVNAVVLIDGTVDLNDETQNLNVVVIPEINAGGASVIYGLAVNPVVGLGSFLAQLFLRNPLSQALSQEYVITGPWKDPVVKKSTSKRKVDIPPADADKAGRP